MDHNVAPDDEGPFFTQFLVTRQEKALFLTPISERSLVADIFSQAAAIEERPYNFDKVARLRTASAHHEAALNAKVTCAVGLGHTDPSVTKKLDALCEHGWISVAREFAMDVLELGTGVLGYFRNRPEGRPKLEQIPVLGVDLVLVNEMTREFHIRDLRNDQILAPFGRLDEFPEAAGEFIWFRQPSNLMSIWGSADWLSAIPSIDLGCSAAQHVYDFHLNRGVPEMIVSVTGARVTKEVKAQIAAALQAGTGPGNSRKSAFINIPTPDAVVEIHHLQLEGDAEAGSYETLAQQVASAIVTAHRIPPSIGGLQIPGKIGAANESVNALILFQALVIGPFQKIIEVKLEKTLGKELGMETMDFATVIDIMAEMMKKLAPADTTARMRVSLPEATAQGRSPNNGLKS